MDPGMLLALDQKLAEFQQYSGWRLSLPAQIVLQQAFVSLETDHLGLRGYTHADSRKSMQSLVLGNVERFLNEITYKAGEAVKEQNLASKEERLIGAIYVMQNMKMLADMISCECWPG